MRRVCSRFALIAAAGELAITAEIVLWKQGDARETCKRLFAEWVGARERQGRSKLKTASRSSRPSSSYMAPPASRTGRRRTRRLSPHRLPPIVRRGSQNGARRLLHPSGRLEGNPPGLRPKGHRQSLRRARCHPECLPREIPRDASTSATGPVVATRSTLQNSMAARHDARDRRARKTCPLRT